MIKTSQTIFGENLNYICIDQSSDQHFSEKNLKKKVKKQRKNQKKINLPNLFQLKVPLSNFMENSVTSWKKHK